MEAMKLELAQLKESLATLSAVQTETAHVSSKLSYASMAKRSNEGKYGHGRRSRGRQLRLEDKSSDGTTKRPESSAGSTVTSATEPNEPAHAAGKRHKIQVIGARRIGQLEKQGAGNGTGTGTGTGAGAGPERYRITSLIRAIKWV